MRRWRATAGANIVAQVIHIEWYKSARGAPGAERRNRIPSVLPLPTKLALAIGRHLLIHESHWSHRNDFAAEVRSVAKAVDAAAGYGIGCAFLRAIEGGVELHWTWSHRCGLPRRQTRDATGDVVPANHMQVAREGQWVRTRWNGRFTDIDTGTWWYESVVFNVGIVPCGEIPTEFFLRSACVDDHAQMALLR